MALVLRYVHDLNDREIAAALGCRRGTANALLSRGRAGLRNCPLCRIWFRLRVAEEPGLELGNPFRQRVVPLAPAVDGGGDVG